MSLTNIAANEGSKDFGRIEDGTYMARIAQIIDTGIQENEWEGVVKEQHQVLITFEFPTERVEVKGEDKPRWLGKSYNISSHEKSTLSKLMLAADPEGKDTFKGRNLKGLLGKPLMVTVGSSAKGNAKVAGVARLMKGMAVPELENPTVFFDLDDQNKDVFDGFPQWVKDKIVNSIGFEKTNFYKVFSSDSKVNNSIDDMDDDIPY